MKLGLFNKIPQAEIDQEARRLIVEYGVEAESIALGNVERAQWAKGNNTTPERTRRVLKAVRKALR